MTAEEIKALLKLEPHPVEGGWYRRTYTSEVSVALLRGVRPYGTAIYYLLEEGTFSEMHMVASDEIFHFYLGDPVEMLLLHPDGGSAAFNFWTGFGGGSAAANSGSGGRVARRTAGGGRKGGALRLHGDAGLRFCRLPQRELHGAGGEVAGEAERIRKLTRSSGVSGASGVRSIGRALIRTAAPERNSAATRPIPPRRFPAPPASGG